ncbi:MAG: hypothetical protein JXR76_06340 [Deltaproteobacteria bacterium]|nr:hypothetical protein [Deltaproteobacteria bacterium]
MTKPNDKKKGIFSNDKVVQTARELIEKMPGWQKTYAKEIIESATRPVSRSSSFPPKMLG